MNTATSVWSIKRLATLPAVAEPLTFNAVRPMSIKGSIEINRPAMPVVKIHVKTCHIAVLG